MYIYIYTKEILSPSQINSPLFLSGMSEIKKRAVPFWNTAQAMFLSHSKLMVERKILCEI